MCVLCVCCCVLPSSAVRAANSCPSPSPAVPKKQGHNPHVCVCVPCLCVRNCVSMCGMCMSVCVRMRELMCCMQVLG